MHYMISLLWYLHSNMSSSEELAIQVVNVYKQYGRGGKAQKVLKGINMDVAYHSMLVVLIIWNIH